MKPRDIPNIITVLRILLVAPIMALLAMQEYRTVLMLFAVAGLSDGVDGFLARQFGWRTPLGALLDPLADKFMLVGVYLMLGWGGLIPWWLVLLVILRDMVIIGGAIAYRRVCGDLTMAPTLISKANTLLQILLGLVVIVGAAGWGMHPAAIDTMIALVALTTLWSGADYVWQWGRRAHDHHTRKRK